ncbi:MAG: hypothetical protein ABFS09_08565 [Thermodesulfobacteriota bacterium]
MKVKIKHFGSTVLLLAALAFITTACTTPGGTADKETLYKRMPATEHQKKFPSGHDGTTGKACFYDRVEDAYFCSFSH